jgi:hypothetical protein
MTWRKRERSIARKPVHNVSNIIALVFNSSTEHEVRIVSPKVQQDQIIFPDGNGD